MDCGFFTSYIPGMYHSDTNNSNTNATQPVERNTLLLEGNDSGKSVFNLLKPPVFLYAILSFRGFKP